MEINNFKKQKMQTSKALAYTVLRVWVIVVLFSCTVLCFQIDATNILVAVSGSLGVVLSGYFTKSFLENKEQFKTVPMQFETEFKQEDINLDTI